MKRTMRSLVLAGLWAIGVGCEGGGADRSLAWYDPELVERMAPECLEAGVDPLVCGCTLHHMAIAMQDEGYFPLAVSGRRARPWPGEQGGSLARWHASCETWAEALGPQTPQVAAGPQR